MALGPALSAIDALAAANVTGISFTAGEPLLFVDDLCRLLERCGKYGIYTRVVTNGFWAGSADDADRVIVRLMSAGLSQLRLSYSRWHQEHISRDNIPRAAQSCLRRGLDYYVSFVTDFAEADDAFEQFLRDHHLKFFPEPVIYFGRADGLERPPVSTDYRPNRCSMNPYLTPEMHMFACCDGADRFKTTDFLYLGHTRTDSVEALFRKKETHPLYRLIRRMGLTNMASYLGFSARDIVRYRKCELCQALFDSEAHLQRLKTGLAKDLMSWHR